MTSRTRPIVLVSLLSSLSLAACASDAPADSQASSTDTNGSETGQDSSDSTGDSATGDGDTSETTETGAEEYTGPLEDWCDTQPAEFSFFVTSMNALWTLSGDSLDNLEGGFGGNFGGLAGADAICQEIAWASGHGDKVWHAFLSVTDDGTGSPVHGIERIGEGPWYDANGRLVASGLAGLAGERPDGDPQTIDDLPDECGVPIKLLGDAHDVPTGSNKQGRLNNPDMDSTCNDWTSDDPSVGSSGGGGPGPGGTVMCGHTFPREGGGGMGGANWVSDHPLRGCGKGANLLQNGPGEGSCIGCSGGYGALYCFAL